MKIRTTYTLISNNLLFSWLQIREKLSLRKWSGGTVKLRALEGTLIRNDYKWESDTGGKFGCASNLKTTTAGLLIVSLQTTWAR